jgi:hypothetical protein
MAVVPAGLPAGPTFFTAGDPGLCEFTCELEDRIAHLFPEFVDGSAAAHLALVPDRLTGRGLRFAAGYRPTKNEAVALYFGRVVVDCPLGDFVLALPSFRRAHRTWLPFVDAGPQCRDPDPVPINAALCNHSCHDSTVLLRQPPELRDCALPCAVAYAKPGVAAGARVLWDYDGGARSGSGAFTVDLAGRVELLQAGFDSVPCACRRALPCPRARWFRVFPAP